MGSSAASGMGSSGAPSSGACSGLGFSGGLLLQEAFLVLLGCWVALEGQLQWALCCSQLGLLQALVLDLLLDNPEDPHHPHEWSLAFSLPLLRVAEAVAGQVPSCVVNLFPACAVQRHLP